MPKIFIATATYASGISAKNYFRQSGRARGQVGGPETRSVVSSCRAATDAPEATVAATHHSRKRQAVEESAVSGQAHLPCFLEGDGFFASVGQIGHVGCQRGAIADLDRRIGLLPAPNAVD